jgi:diacylglycerol kinase family enzyme
VDLDGRSVHIRASEIFVANSGILLGLKALELDPDASLDSGKLSVCHIRLKSIFEYVRVAFKMITKPSEENEELDCMDAMREVKIRTSRPIPVQGDGELIGNTPVTITLIPHAIHVWLPKKQD